MYMDLYQHHIFNIFLSYPSSPSLHTCFAACGLVVFMELSTIAQIVLLSYSSSELNMAYKFFTLFFPSASLCIYQHWISSYKTPEVLRALCAPLRLVKLYRHYKGLSTLMLMPAKHLSLGGCFFSQSSERQSFAGITMSVNKPQGPYVHTTVSVTACYRPAITHTMHSTVFIILYITPLCHTSTPHRRYIHTYMLHIHMPYIKHTQPPYYSKYMPFRSITHPINIPLTNSNNTVDHSARSCHTTPLHGR